MKAWLRALIRWLEGGDWHSFDEDHCCAGCEATTARIRRALAPYGSQAEQDYEARRLIAEATASIPIYLLDQWVEQ